MEKSGTFPSEEEMMRFMQDPLLSAPYMKTNGQSETEILRQIIKDAAKYEIGDLLAKISALNLMIENQNKSVFFDVLIAALISQPIDLYKSKKTIETRELRNLISKLGKTGLTQTIDPPEVLFIDRVRFYGNYWVFSGINYIPANIIQRFIDALVFNEESFNSQFYQIALHLINFALSISNEIANKLEYNAKTQRKTDKKYVQIPNHNEIRKYATTLVFSIEHLNDVLKMSDNSFLFSKFAETELGDALIGDAQLFYQHPFIKTNENTCVLLNPTILVPFVIHRIILEAERFGQKTILLSLYNERNWIECIKALKQLGHKKVKEESLGINLLSTENYKEGFFSVGYNSLLWAGFFCDDGDEYTEKSMFDIYAISDEKVPKHEHIIEIEEQLAKNKLVCVGYIVIICSFGRVIWFSNAFARKKKIISINPYELYCISVNEFKTRLFLPRYIKAKSIIKKEIGIVSELNAIEAYRSNGYSFYINDDFNVRDVTVFFSPGDSLDYIVRASEEDRQLIENNDGIHLEDVTLFDKTRAIYAPIKIREQFKYLIPTDNSLIWLWANSPQSMEELNIIQSLLDALSFWLAECRAVLNSIALQNKLTCIQIRLVGEISQYRKLQENASGIETLLQYYNNDNNIIMEWTPQAYQYTHCQTNDHEKEIVLSLLNQLEKHGSGRVNRELVSDIFANKNKKKFFSIDLSDHPEYKPIIDRTPDFDFQLRDEMLDDVGEYIKKGYGIPEDKSSWDGVKVVNDIVGFLYQKLQFGVEQLKIDHLYERLCYDLETVLYFMLFSRQRYIYDVACYPEREEQYISEIKRLNEKSVALKFLLEYVAACPPTGNIPIDETSYSKLLTICSEIINWAYTNDLFFYHAVHSPISLFGSGRIKIERREIDYLAEVNSSAVETQLRNRSDPSREQFYIPGLIDKYSSQLNEAFMGEFGFTIHEILQCIGCITDIGNRSDEEVKKHNYSETIKYINCETGLNNEKIKEIIAMISLKKRDDYLDPPSPYKKEDVYPWRFNRELSFTRRPIIYYGDTLIWGNRQLYHMAMYCLELMEKGKFKARTDKLKKVFGKIDNERGNLFTEAIARKIESYHGIIVHSKVSKINKKKIENEHKQDLGDIDVLCIIPESFSIIAFEVKDFSFAKNPYEMEKEYERMFVDGDKPCYTTKHMRRVEWVQRHIKDVIAEYNLVSGKWKVKEAYIVNEEIISNKFHKKGKTILLYSNLTEAGIKAL